MSSTSPDDQAATPPSWQQQLQRYLDTLDAEQLASLRANAVRRLDRATRARSLEVDELARLSALAEYLSERLDRRLRDGGSPRLDEVLLMGLIAGYQLASGEQTPQEPDPFPE